MDNSKQHIYKDNGKRLELLRLEDYTEEMKQALDKKYERLNELSQFIPIIRSQIAQYDTKSDKKTMMIKGLRKSNNETKQRMSHQKNHAEISVEIAKGINQKLSDEKNPKFNIKVVEVMSRFHDIGHTFLGHSGEWWLSNIGEDYGIGYYVHNAIGARELIYNKKIYDEIISKIKENNPGISDKKLNRIKSSLWLIMEAINSHNGESPQTRYSPNLLKNEKEFEDENLKCYTKKGFDKTIIPATPEACLMRLTDKVSYAPYDMIDGLREGFISELDDEYIEVLTQIGISKQEIYEANETKNYDDIAKKIQKIWIQDIVQNSDLTNIQMSEKQDLLLKQLISINNKKIVNYVVLQEDNDTYPPALKKLMNAFGRVVLREGLLESLKEPNDPKNQEQFETLKEKYKNTPIYGFIEYTLNTSKEDFEYTQKIVKEATKQGIEDEQEKARQVVVNGEDFYISPEFKLRDIRIKNYIKYYESKNIKENEYSDQDKKQDVEQIMENIKSPRKRNYAYFSPRKRIALELGRKYLATLDDFEFINLLLNTNLINENEYKSLTRKYKDFDFKSEQYIQSNWSAIVKTQESAIKKPSISPGGDIR